MFGVLQSFLEHSFEGSEWLDRGLMTPFHWFSFRVLQRFGPCIVPIGTHVGPTKRIQVRPQQHSCLLKGPLRVVMRSFSYQLFLGFPLPMCSRRRPHVYT